MTKKTGFLALLFTLLLSNVIAAGFDNGPSSKKSVLGPENVALVINDADANSVKVGEYYRVSRGIPTKNIVHVRIPDAPRKLSLSEFTRLKWEIEAQLNSDEQVILLAWTAPYAVECNSITSALTFGYDAEQCKNTCAPGKPSPYFNSASKKPFDDYGIRLAMLLPTDSVSNAKALIDRGVQSDAGVFRSTAYYLSTSDAARNSRAQFFPPTGLSIPSSGMAVLNLKSDKLIGARDVMIYQTGLAWVDELDSLNFLPGALADHLTSVGGDLYGKGQMSILRWLDAGATASYGTVSEPCNYWQKFPNPAVMLKWYVNGATAVEAYWKSVAWPAQGLFVGEPLAAPYAHQ
ncbi:TIGR03790 family protein [Methylotenera sp.]|uniref:TIGR03790 family protein n=1 Tax=Methylotenera sp. TaxID=2051956 RepID=UPI002730C026|nr:TIGR03790 family protein [Methylotenera sp.]MDP2071665.1 TIGR03790 family protein [Methylotenera sp.]MDP2231508.1 TIGR03790 family protein [Methylotenera sp.]MDP3006755.1 TIGR03790 family protein [Methylotenera sp.]